MPSREQTSLINFAGGLDKVTNKVLLFQTPGKADKLINFEGGVHGGYRRINGYTKYSPNSPDGVGTDPVVSAISYAGGCIAVQGGNIYYSEDAVSWIQVNKDTGDTFVSEATLAGLSALPRNTNDAERYNFERFHNGVADGLLIVDTLGTNPLALLNIQINSGVKEYKYQEARDASWGTGNTRFPTIVESHGERAVVSGDLKFANEVYYSDLFNPLDFIGGGVINLADEIVALETFRENLIALNKNSLKRIISIGDPLNQTILPITKKVGCLAGSSVQQTAAGLIFLAPDGLRTIAATDRFSDFELGTLTSDIRPEILKVLELEPSSDIVSTLVRSRNQYRIFVTSQGITSKALGGVLRSDGTIEWNTFAGLDVHDLHSDKDDNGNEQIFQTKLDGFVYLHDEGINFDGVPIQSYFQTPEMSFGDPNIRKTLHRVEIYSEIEGPVQYNFKIIYDFEADNAPSSDIYNTPLSNVTSYYQVDDYNSTAVYYQKGIKTKATSVQGSGKLISFLFEATEDSSPFTLQAMNISYFMNGRY